MAKTNIRFSLKKISTTEHYYIVSLQILEQRQSATDMAWNNPTFVVCILVPSRVIFNRLIDVDYQPYLTNDYISLRGSEKGGDLITCTTDLLSEKYFPSEEFIGDTLLCIKAWSDNVNRGWDKRTVDIPRKIMTLSEDGIYEF